MMLHLINTVALIFILQIKCNALAITPTPKTGGSTINPPASSLSTSSSPHPPLPRPPPEIWPQLVVGGKEDPAMGCIENNQRKSGKPYGHVLDAGTGIYSLRWLAGLLYRHSNPDDALYMSSFVAVTADENFRRECQVKADELGVSDRGEIVKGNWDDDEQREEEGNTTTTTTTNNNMDNLGEKKPSLCEGQLFDTILADYLVGAVDHFSPFFQDQLFIRLSKHLKHGGVLHLTGLNPIPEKVDGPGNIFCQITKLRDACILLAGARPYREHPSDWIVRHLERSGLEVVNVSTFEKIYDYNKIKIQLDACRSTLPFIDDTDLRYAMSARIDKVEEETKQICSACPDGKFTLGFDWVITAIKTR